MPWIRLFSGHVRVSRDNIGLHQHTNYSACRRSRRLFDDDIGYCYQIALCALKLHSRQNLSAGDCLLKFIL